MWSPKQEVEIIVLLLSLIIQDVAVPCRRVGYRGGGAMGAEAPLQINDIHIH